MISFWSERENSSLIIRNPLAFFVNLFKKKKYKIKKKDVKNNTKAGKSPKVPTVLSVSVMDMRMSSPCPLSPALSTLTLTPGRTRDIDQDMEALRLSRQDNPFLQVLASRESLVESLFESESDDINLMSQEFPNEFEVDPLSLPEIHEHMIRSPPPTTWPKSPNYKVFRFPSSQESLQVGCDQFGSFGKSSVKVLSSTSVKEEVEASHQKGNISPENCCKNYFTIHALNLPNCNGDSPHKRSNSECRGSDSNVSTSVRTSPVRSQLDIRSSQFEDINKVGGESHQRFAEAPLTLPLLSKKLT